MEDAPLAHRANALTEAVEKKEWMLRHLDGGYLVADGLTKQLAGTLHERLIKELLLRDGREAAVDVSEAAQSGCP